MPWIFTVSPRSLAAGGVEVTGGHRRARDAALADVEAFCARACSRLTGHERRPETTWPGLPGPRFDPGGEPARRDQAQLGCSTLLAGSLTLVMSTIELYDPEALAAAPVVLTSEATRWPPSRAIQTSEVNEAVTPNIPP